MIKKDCDKTNYRLYPLFEPNLKVVTGIKFINEVAGRQGMVAAVAKAVYRGTALEKYRYQLRGGLNVSLWTTEEYNTFFLRNAIVEAMSGLENGDYHLALIEGLRFGGRGIEERLQEVLEGTIVDPFINPLSRESFDMFCRLKDNCGLSLEQKAAHFIGAWSAYKGQQGYSQNGVDNAFLRTFSQYFTRDELEKVKTRAGERKQKLGTGNYWAEQQSYLRKSLFEINAGSYEEIIRHLCRNPGANIFAYCLKDRKEAVNMAAEELREN